MDDDVKVVRKYQPGLRSQRHIGEHPIVAPGHNEVAGVVRARPFIADAGTPTIQVVIAQRDAGGVAERGWHYGQQVGVVDRIDLWPQRGIRTSNSASVVVSFQVEASW